MPRCPRCDQDNAPGASHCEQCGAALPREPEPELASAHSGELEGELRALLAAGKKIEAIKRFREATGAGLKAAIEAVEALAALPGGGALGDDLGSLEGELVGLLGAGRKIDAIKRYREATGADLKAAKDAVEALARRHGLPAGGGGCLGAATLLVLAALGAGVALAAR